MLIHFCHNKHLSQNKIYRKKDAIRVSTYDAQLAKFDKSFANDMIQLLLCHRGAVCEIVLEIAFVSGKLRARVCIL